MLSKILMLNKSKNHTKSMQISFYAMVYFYVVELQKKKLKFFMEYFKMVVYHNIHLFQLQIKICLPTLSSCVCFQQYTSFNGLGIFQEFLVLLKMISRNYQKSMKISVKRSSSMLFMEKHNQN
jgi:hypothetical protein